jgi:heterodisulfide reductase subunit A
MVCPYGAVSLTQESNWKRVAMVSEALCKGCGTCVAECPTGAMELRHYRSEQIVGLLDELLGRDEG